MIFITYDRAEAEEENKRNHLVIMRTKKINASMANKMSKENLFYWLTFPLLIRLEWMKVLIGLSGTTVS